MASQNLLPNANGAESIAGWFEKIENEHWRSARFPTTEVRFGKIFL